MRRFGVTQSPGHGGTAHTAEAELPDAGQAAEQAAAGAPSVTGEPTATVEPDPVSAAVPDPASSPVPEAAARAERDPVATARPELPEPGRTVSPSARRRFAWLGRRWVAVVIFVVIGIGLFFAYLLQARTMAIHLDAASASGPQTLQAWDMLHGNPLLRGWQLADVSFYTTDLPEYVAVEADRGLGGDVAHVAAALAYTLIVLLAGLLAKGRATGREGLVRLLVAVGIMLAPTLVAGTSVMLSGPDHTGTQVPLLLIWLVLDRGRPRWWVPAAIALLLTWAMVADLLVLYEGVLPLVAVCVVGMHRRRRFLRPDAAGRLHDCWRAGRSVLGESGEPAGDIRRRILQPAVRCRRARRAAASSRGDPGGMGRGGGSPAALPRWRADHPGADRRVPRAAGRVHARNKAGSERDDRAAADRCGARRPSAGRPADQRRPGAGHGGRARYPRCGARVQRVSSGAGRGHPAGCGLAGGPSSDLRPWPVRGSQQRHRVQR